NQTAVPQSRDESVPIRTEVSPYLKVIVVVVYVYEFNRIFSPNTVEPHPILHHPPEDGVDVTATMGEVIKKDPPWSRKWHSKALCTLKPPCIPPGEYGYSVIA